MFSNENIRYSKKVPHYAVRHCPNHKGGAYIPISKLSSDQLPATLGSSDILELIHHISSWVVRVRVIRDAGTIANRNSGSEALKGSAYYTCSGIVTGISREAVTVRIPARAVRNELEARHTTVDFFFDDTDNTSGILKLPGLSVSHQDGSKTSVLTCLGTPELLASFSQHLWKQHSCKGVLIRRSSSDSSLQENNMQRKSESVMLPCTISKAKGHVDDSGRDHMQNQNIDIGCMKIRLQDVDMNLVNSSKDSACVFISHPHGFAKAVSFGHVCGVEAVITGQLGLEKEVNAPKRRLMSKVDLQVANVDDVHSFVDQSRVDIQTKAVTEPAANVDSASYLTKSKRSQPSTSVTWNPGGWQTLIQSWHKEACPAQKSPEQRCVKSGGQTIWDMVWDTTSVFLSKAWMIIYRIILINPISVIMYFLRPPKKQIVTWRVEHTAMSCPGSSGGALIVFGQDTLAKLPKKLRSHPVFSHVGVMIDKQVCVAVLSTKES